MVDVVSTRCGGTGCGIIKTMTPRLLVLSLATLFAAATAHAQAPGEWTPAPSDLPPGPVAPVAAPMQKWSVGLNVGQTDLTPEADVYYGDGGYSMQTATFAGGSLALRYRGWQHLELELSIGGGRQQYEDGSEGDLAMATGTLAARYRFNPRNKWNWWLLAGLGATTVARHDATDAELDSAQRPHGTLGVGLEYRFTQFALQLELRGMRVGPTDEEQQLIDEGAMIPAGMSGGSFAFGASYYF